MSTPPIVMRPRLDVVQPRGEVAERRLPRSGLADERRRRARCDGERDVLERPLLAVAEPDTVEDDVPRPRDRDRVGLLLDVDRVVEVLEDPVEERERRLHVEADAEQRADREEEPRLQRRERHEHRDRDRVRSVRQRQAAEPVDGCGHDREARLDRGHHPAAGHPLAHLEVGEPQRVGLEPVGELGARGPSSSRAGSPRPRATPGRGWRCRRASPASSSRSGGARCRPGA